jgi:hypothetical protein
MRDGKGPKGTVGRASKVDLLGNRFCLDYVDQAISWDTRQINHAQPRARPHAEFGDLYAIAKVGIARR